MNIINDEFSTDSKSTPVKVNLPDGLVKQINDFCEATKTSKSELVRNSLINGLYQESRWLNKQYFFPSRLVNQSEAIKSFFSDAPVNTLIKLAINNVDNPASARLVIGYFQKIFEGQVSFYIPPFISHHSLINAAQEINQISTSQSRLAFPEIEQAINAFGLIEMKCIYTLPLEYIWEYHLS